MSVGKKHYNEEFLLDNLGSTIQSWLSYHLAIGQYDMIVESSINYPFGDYLRPYLKRDPKISPLEFEVKLSQFKYKRCDAKCILNDGTSYFFEFKYTKKGSTLEDYEQARVLFDLIRLRSIEESSKKIFIMCGKSDEFEMTFENFDKNKSINLNNQKKKNGASPLPPNYFYQKLFSFDSTDSITRTKKIDLRSTDPDIISCVDVFVKEYKDKCCENIDEFVNKISHIKTKLEWLSPNEAPANVGIWSVDVY